MKKFVLIFLFPLVANATEPELVPMNVLCLDTKMVVKQLDGFQEIPVAIGSGVGNAKDLVMTLWNNPKTKTWTLLLSGKDEKSCIIGVGEKLDIRYPDTINRFKSSGKQ
jgi:hypothetical protein